LSGTSGGESGDDNDRITFESNGGCSVTIVETRVKAGPKFWIKTAFSLSDIDTEDIRIHPMPEENISTVLFHTISYRKTLLASSNTMPDPFPTPDYFFDTTQGFAPRLNTQRNCAELNLLLFDQTSQIEETQWTTGLHKC
jgi:hypothetical protein